MAYRRQRRRKSYVPDSIPPKEIVRKFTVALSPIILYSRNGGTSVGGEFGFCTYPNSPIDGSSLHAANQPGAHAVGWDHWTRVCGYSQGFVSYYKSKATLQYYGDSHKSLDLLSWLDDPLEPLRPIAVNGALAPDSMVRKPWLFKQFPTVIARKVTNPVERTTGIYIKRKINSLKYLGLSSVDEAFQGDPTVAGSNAARYTFQCAAGPTYRLPTHLIRERYGLGLRLSDKFLIAPGLTAAGNEELHAGTGSDFPYLQVTLTFYVHLRNPLSTVEYVDKTG